MNRFEVYEAVWAAPMAQAAATLGVGERALANACRKAGIPTPPRGHWRKVAAGQAGERPPLGEAPAGKEAITMPLEAAPRCSTSVPQIQQLPTGALEGSAPTRLPPKATTSLRPDFSPQMIDAVVDALAADYQRAEARRVLLAQVIGTIGQGAGPDAPAVRRALQLLQDFGSRKIVEAAAAFIEIATHGADRNMP